MKNKTRCFSKLSLIAAAAALAVSAAPQAKAYDWVNWNNVSDSVNFGPNSIGGVNSPDFLNPRLEMIRAGVFQVPNATVNFNDNNFEFFGWGDSGFDFDLQAVNGGGTVHVYDREFGTDDARNLILTGDDLLPIQSDALRLFRFLGNDSGDGNVNLDYNFSYNERTFQAARTGLGINGNDSVTFAPAFALDNSVAVNSVFQVADEFDVTALGSVVRNGSITLGLVNGVEVLDGLYAKDAGWLDIRGDLTLYQNGTLYIRDAEVTSNVYRNDNLGIGGEGEGLYETRGTLAFDSGILSVRQRFAQDMAVNEGQTLGFRDGAVNATSFDISGGGYWQTSNLVGGFVGGENFYTPIGGDGFFGVGGFLGGGNALENAQLYVLLGGGALRSITGNNVQNGNITIGQVQPTYFNDIFSGEGFSDITYGRINSDEYLNAQSQITRSVLTINGNVNGVNSFASNGGSLAIFGGDGDIIVNGQVGAGVSVVYKDGRGELVLTAANVYGDSDLFLPTSSTYVTSGSVRATNAQAFGAGRVEVTAFGLKEFVGAVSGEGEGAAPIGGSVILDPTYSSRGNLTFANDFRLGGFGQVDALFGEGEGQFDAGTGVALTTASLVNQSGNNTITGDISVGSNVFSLVGISGEGEGLEVNDASILVANGTTLTVNGDVVASFNATGTRTQLFVAAVNQGLNTGTFHVTGDLLGVEELTKNGNGLARFARVDGALDRVNVNAGTLRIDGSVDSTALAPYGSFDKYGAGKLEVRGTHHYSSFDTYAGTSDIYGSVTLQGPATNGDFDIENGATVNVENGGSLIHISTDGEGGSFTNGFDIIGASTLNVKSGGVVNLNGAEIDLGDPDVLGDASSVIVSGVLSTTDAIYSYSSSIVTVLAGGVINANIETQDDIVTPRHGSTITVSGALNGNIDLNQTSTLEVRSGGVLTGNIQADDDSILTLRTGGTIVGNVDTFNDAQFIIEANSTHTGDYNAYGAATIVVNGTIGEGSLFAQNFRLSGDALLTGGGRINGSLQQTGGVVAPGNSPGILNIGGAYSITAGSLQVEIDGLAGAGAVAGHDQLRVGGTITLDGTSVLNFDLGNSYQSQRGAAFQVLADATGVAKASVGRFDTVLWQDSNFRVLFDHSTGRAYGTGLNYGQGGNSFQTFTQYASNANRLEIARALWMESIDYDNSDLGLDGIVPIVDQNFATTATGVNGVADAQAKRGYKAYILTTPQFDGEGAPLLQAPTDLGQAAVSVLTAADVGAALDALSPEAYAGITDLGIRVARGFAFLPFNQRRMGAVNEWDFSVGYNNDEVEADATSSYNSYKVRSNQVNVTAARDLSSNARFTLGVGSDEGRVLAQNFTADVDTLGLGLGLALTPDSDAYRLDLGIGFTTSDWDSRRQGVSAGNDMDTMAFAARLTINTKAQGNFSYKPFAALSYTDASIDSFVEADAPGSVQLGVSGFERKSLLGELGMDFEYKLGAQTSLTGIVSWQHEFQDSGATDLRAEFVEDGVDDTAFSVRSAGFGQDFFRAGLGLRHELNPTSAVSLSVNAIFGSDIGSGHQVRADYSIRF
jgi:cytoskeletal protein CcmA (bactofilin family)